MIDDYVPDKSELKDQGVEGNYDEVQQDTYEDTALALKNAGVSVDVSGIDDSVNARRRRRPWYARNYGTGYVILGQQRYQVGPVPAGEVYAWFTDLIGLFGAYNVDVHSSPASFQTYRLVRRYAWEMFKWFRVVKEKASLSYAGVMSVGNGLVLDKILPQDLDKTDWLQTLSATGATDYFGTSSASVEIAKNAGLAIFGHTDEVVYIGEESPVDQIMVTKNGVNYAAHGLNFRMSDGVEDNRGIFSFVPNDTVYMQINATAAKNTEYHPIGVVLIPMDKAKTLATNRIKA